jgi:hypothetical protein
VLWDSWRHLSYSLASTRGGEQRSRAHISPMLNVANCSASNNPNRPSLSCYEDTTKFRSTSRQHTHATIAASLVTPPSGLLAHFVHNLLVSGRYLEACHPLRCAGARALHRPVYPGPTSSACDKPRQTHTSTRTNSLAISLQLCYTRGSHSPTAGLPLCCLPLSGVENRDIPMSQPQSCSESFSATLKRYRRRARMTQEALAAATGYTAGYISLLER